MTAFVLVPGACHGGWWYEPLTEELAAAGHRSYAVTPTGLDPDDDTPMAAVNLDTHVDQVTAALRHALIEGADDVVLVGHSYGGCLISGAADAMAERVRALVYLDGFVPENGDSAYAMADDEQRRWYIEGAGRSGLAVEPLEFFDARARPHPLATLVQRSKLTGAWRSVPVKHYVEALGWPTGSPFAATAQRLRADPSWIVHSWPTRHNVLADGPQRVLELIGAL